MCSPLSIGIYERNDMEGGGGVVMEIAYKGSRLGRSLSKKKGGQVKLEERHESESNDTKQ
jgi:hypothetical protein